MASRQRTFITQDLTDDSTGITPMVGLKTPMTLKNRFIGRLTELVGAKITLVEDSERQAMEIHLLQTQNFPQAPLNGEKKCLLDTIAKSMSLMARNSEGSRYDHGIEELWDAILTFSHPNVDQVVSGLNSMFESETFQTFIQDYAMPEPGSTADEELGRLLISLYQDVKYCECSLKNINKLVQAASTMTRVLPDMDQRLRFCLWKAKYANEMYQLICELGFPERFHNTVIRAARTSKTFRNTTFHLGRLPLPKPGPYKHHAKGTSAAAPKPASSPQIVNSKQPRSQQATSKASFPSSSSSSYPFASSDLAVIEPFLRQEDRHKTLLRLEPVTKRNVAQLASSVVRGNIPPVDSQAWYLFGFAAAADEEEERVLGGLYSEILKEAHDQQAAFVEIQRALESNSLIDLFKAKGFGQICDFVPHLQPYLGTALEARSTAFRLKQFILDENETEPPASLQRDYGFKFCKQREEVLLLKDIYRKICKTVSLKDLHSACVHGRLYETCVKKGVLIDAQHRRLMQNDYPSPFVGYDNGKGLDNYRGPFFKKRLCL